MTKVIQTRPLKNHALSGIWAALYAMAKYQADQCDWRSHENRFGALQRVFNDRAAQVQEKVDTTGVEPPTGADVEGVTRLFVEIAGDYAPHDAHSTEHIMAMFCRIVRREMGEDALQTLADCAGDELKFQTPFK